VQFVLSGIKIYNTNPILKIDDHTYDVILVLVAHNQFKNFGLNKIKASCKKNHIIFDIKNLFKNNKLDFKL
jgi:UDP-N-acetyl-D-galactosamine dehydrogenase